jgi:hypothetical protein
MEMKNKLCSRVIKLYNKYFAFLCALVGLTLHECILARNQILPPSLKGLFSNIEKGCITKLYKGSICFFATQKILQRYAKFTQNSQSKPLWYFAYLRLGGTKKSKLLKEFAL